MSTTTLRSWGWTAILAALALGSRAPAAGGSDVPAPAPRSEAFFNRELGANRRSGARRPGESEGQYAIRTSHLSAGLASSASPETVGAGGGTADRAAKLRDASRLAREGRSAAMAQTSDMAVAFSNAVINAASPVGGSAPAGDLVAIAGALRSYAALWKGMSEAAFHNEAGERRLRFDPGTGKNGTPPLSRPYASLFLESMSEEARKRLEDRGVEPEALVARLVSGEIEAHDPIALLGAIGVTRDLTEAELRILEERKGKSPEASFPMPHERARAWREAYRENGEREGAGVVAFGAEPAIRRDRGEEGDEGRDGFSDADSPAERALVLWEHGISDPRRGTSIFRIARRKFRQFRGWRRSRPKRVAVSP